MSSLKRTWRKKFKRVIKEKFPGVGDLSSYPVNKKMAKLVVKASEVQ